MHQLRQTAVELPRTSQNAGRCINHALQFVDDNHWSGCVLMLQSIRT